jgi:hypothetical protein
VIVRAIWWNAAPGLVVYQLETPPLAPVIPPVLAPVSSATDAVCYHRGRTDDSGGARYGATTQHPGSTNSVSA